MASWHERLQTALGVRGKSWIDLVAATGLTEQSVYAWRPDASRRTVMMNGASSARVCTYLAIFPLWLFEGIEPSGLENGHSHAGRPFKASAEEIELIDRLRLLDVDDARAVRRIVNALAD